jgi:uncharacterized protein involved in exopolysaccharide biosynthesis
LLQLVGTLFFSYLEANCKIKIAVWVFFCAAIASYLTLVQVREYESSGSIFVISKANPLADLKAEAGAGGGGGMDLDAPMAQYIRTLIDSDTIKLDIARRLDVAELNQLWEGKRESVRTRTGLLKILASATKVGSRLGLIRVTVRTTRPQLSEKIDTLYFTILESKLGSEVHQEEDFLERQLTTTKARIARLEKNLGKFESETGIVAPQADYAGELFKELAQFQAEFDKTRIELEETNSRIVAPGLPEQQLTLVAEKEALSTRETAVARVIRSRQLELKPFPRSLVTLEGMMRELKLNETLYEQLAENYEQARLKDAGKQLPFKYVDRPLRPELPVSRQFPLHLALGCSLGLFIGILHSFFSYNRQLHLGPSNAVLGA